MAFCSRRSSRAESVAAPPADGRTSSTTTLLPSVAAIRGHSTRAAAAAPGSCSVRIRQTRTRASSFVAFWRDLRRRQARQSALLLVQKPVHDDIVDLRHAILVDGWPIAGHTAAE